MCGGASFSSVISLNVGTMFFVSGVGQGHEMDLRLFQTRAFDACIPSIIDIFCFLPVSEGFKIWIVENL